MNQDDWSISVRTELSGQARSCLPSQPRYVPATYVYCCGNVRAAAPGHDAPKIKMIWMDTKQTMLQDLLPIAIFH